MSLSLAYGPENLKNNPRCKVHQDTTNSSVFAKINWKIKSCQTIEIDSTEKQFGYTLMDANP